MIRCWYSEGALLADTAIPGVTQELIPDTARHYGGRFFIAETLTRIAARRIAEALGCEWFEERPKEEQQ